MSKYTQVKAIPIRTEREAQAFIKEFILPFEGGSGYPHSSLMYGTGYWLKKHLVLPEQLTMFNVDMPHSPYLQLTGLSHKVHEIKAPYLCYNDDQLAFLKSHGATAMSMGSPFVHCRQYLGLEPDENRTGTLAFPPHSTLHTTWKDDQLRYIEELKSLPEKFQPVSVALYFLEMLKGSYKVFLENGITVYSTGHMLDDNFPVRFYHNIKSFKYGTTAMFGSHVFYGVEMGIPFFIYGTNPTLEKTGDPHRGKTFVNHRYDMIGSKERRVDELLTFDLEGPVEIHPDFLTFANKVLGMSSKRDPKAIRQLLLDRYNKFKITQLIPNWIKRLIAP